MASAQSQDRSQWQKPFCRVTCHKAIHTAAKGCWLTTLSSAFIPKVLQSLPPGNRKYLAWTACRFWEAEQQMHDGPSETWWCFRQAHVDARLWTSMHVHAEGWTPRLWSHLLSPRCTWTAGVWMSPSGKSPEAARGWGNPALRKIWVWFPHRFIWTANVELFYCKVGSYFLMGISYEKSRLRAKWDGSQLAWTPISFKDEQINMISDVLW